MPAVKKVAKAADNITPLLPTKEKHIARLVKRKEEQDAGGEEGCEGCCKEACGRDKEDSGG